VEQNEKLLSLGKAAQFLGVSTASLRKWSDQGLVPVYRTVAGHRRYSLADLQQFVESMRESPSRPSTANTTRRASRPGSAS
jgi:predicted site-specific integrase-resolvase